ncbi:response regulator transcription factor [Pleionea sediminis]|uniref:response regulator transcription factor n=1 Tax=Pleionea sediminis TaxID=2569479 RepID=UPI001184CCC0|nr:response regulator transcription factor [Pleionea sediminis]
MSPLSKSRLFVTIDKLLYREALMYQLLLQPDIEIVGESSRGAETISEIESSKASILVIEESLIDNDGLTVSEALLKCHPALLIILLVDKEISQRRLLIYQDAGIKSVVSKSQSFKDILNAIYRVQSGLFFNSSEEFQKYQVNIEKDQCKFQELSKREQEVAKLIAQRVAVKEIASLLGVASKTVHTYKERVFAKMDIERLPELMLFMHRYSRKIAM